MDKEKAKRDAPSWAAVILAVATAITATVQYFDTRGDQEKAQEVTMASDKLIVESLLGEINGLKTDVEDLEDENRELRVTVAIHASMLGMGESVPAIAVDLEETGGGAESEGEPDRPLAKAEPKKKKSSESAEVQQKIFEQLEQKAAAY